MAREGTSSTQLDAAPPPRFLGRTPRAWSEPLAPGPRVACSVVLSGALLAAAAAVFEPHPREAVSSLACMIVAFAIGFAWAVVRTQKQRGALGLVALGSAAGGLVFGLVAGAFTLFAGTSQRGVLTFLMLFAPAIAASVCAPLCAAAFAPVLIAGSRAMRAPSHDGPSVVLVVAGAWGALVASTVAIVGGNPLAWLVAGAAATLAGAGAAVRASFVAELARLRAGAIAGLALSSREEAAGLEGAERALPLLRGGASAPSAWIVSDATGDGYREAPARVVLARVHAGDAEAPGLLRAAFAGAKPERWEAIVLALWTAGLAGLLEWGLMRAHR